MKQKRKNKNLKNRVFLFSPGFSFLEVMIGCMLFTIGTIGIYSVYTSGERSRYFASQRIKALYLANGHMNKLEAQGYVGLKPAKNIIPEGFEEYVIHVKVSPIHTKHGSHQIGKNVSLDILYQLQDEQQKFTLNSQFYEED